MHERFVLEQLVFVVLRKTRRRTQADAGRARRSFCDQVWVDLDHDLVMIEKLAHTLLQFVAQQFRRDAVLGVVAGDFAIELIGQRDEMPGRVDIADRSARQTIARAPEQTDRMLSDRRGTDRIEQFGRYLPRLHGAPQIVADRMQRVGAQEDVFEFFACARIVGGCIFDFGQLHAAGAPAFQKVALHIRRPADASQQLDALHRHDQAPIKFSKAGQCL